jgi:hypothetical protein
MRTWLTNPQTIGIAASIATILMMVGGIIGALADNAPITIPWITESPCERRVGELVPERKWIEPGAAISVTIAVAKPTAGLVTFLWYTDFGRMNPNKRTPFSDATYTAPDFPIEDTIGVEISIPHCPPITRTLLITVFAAPGGTPAPGASPADPLE